MTEPARHLLRALATRGRCQVADLGLTLAQIEQGLRALDDIVDDDNHRVVLVSVERQSSAIVALELTPSGLGVALSS